MVRVFYIGDCSFNDYKITTPVNNTNGGVVMNEIEELLKDIEMLRDNLQQLIERKKGNLIDTDVIAASKILNGVLNQYNKFLKEKINNES